MDALPKTIRLERIRPTEVEPIEEREAIAAKLRAATPEAVADYLKALADNIRAMALQPIDDDDDKDYELPCDEQCVLASYLRLGGKVGHFITDEDKQAVADATSISLARVSRLLCGDPWTPEEEEAIEAYVGNPKFTLAGLAELAASTLNANHNPNP